MSNVGKDINVHNNMFLLNIYSYKILAKCTFSTFTLQYKYNYVLIQVCSSIFAGTCGFEIYL